MLFPDWHELTRWQNNKGRFEGPIRLGDWFNFYELPAVLRTEEIAVALGVDLSASDYSEESDNFSGPGTLVCGSPNEISNNPWEGGSAGKGAFDAFTDVFQTSFEELRLQRRTAWTIAALNDPGQLRQRVAWALSQILVISPDSITEGQFLTEAFLVYYDIFVSPRLKRFESDLRVYLTNKMILCPCRSATHLETTGISCVRCPTPRW